MAKRTGGVAANNSHAPFRKTLLRLMLLDAKDRVHIVLGEVLHTIANARFFACCRPDDDSPSVYLRNQILRASEQLAQMLWEDDAAIDQLLARLKGSEGLHILEQQQLMRDIFMQRDKVLHHQDERLKGLSWIQHALCQELEAKPSYSPNLPIFKRREQERVKEALIDMARDNRWMVEGFFRKYLEKVHTDKDKAAQGNNQTRTLKKEIIIVWEHFNTTKFGLLNRDHNHDPNTVVLRVPQYFMDQKLYFPHITHELVHLAIKDTRLFDLEDFTRLRRNLKFIFRDNPFYDNQETEEWIDNLLEEIFADVISIALEGSSYLMALFLTLVGQDHRHLLVRSMPPELSPFPWWIRIKMVVQYLRIKRDSKKPPEEDPWIEAVDKLIDRYREALRTHFGFEPQQTNLMEVMEYEQYIYDVLSKHLEDYIRKIHDVRKKQQQEIKPEDRTINYYNLKLNEFSIQEIIKMSNKEPDKYTDLGPTLKTGKFYSINNIIWRTYIQSIHDEKHFDGDENYFSLGAIFQLCYDHLELSRAWQKNKLGPSIKFDDLKIPVINNEEKNLYEGYFIKARLDGRIEKEDGRLVCRLVQNDPEFIVNLKQIVEDLPKNPEFKKRDLRVFKCLTSYDFFFIRQGITTRRLIPDCPVLKFSEITGLAAYAERRLLARYKTIGKRNEAKEGPCYSLVMEIRLQERWRLKEFLEELTRNLNNEAKTTKRFEVADIFISLDWQDVLLLVEGIEPGLIQELLRMYEDHIPQVNRTESSILIKTKKFEDLLAVDENNKGIEKVPENFTILVYLRVNSLYKKEDINRQLKKLAVDAGADKFGYFPGVYDGFFQWQAGAEYSKIFNFLGLATEYLSDCKFEVIIHPKT